MHAMQTASRIGDMVRSIHRHGGDQKILPGKNGPRTLVYDLRAEYNLR
jgi:hypothetical protein